MFILSFITLITQDNTKVKFHKNIVKNSIYFSKIIYESKTDTLQVNYSKNSLERIQDFFVYNKKSICSGINEIDLLELCEIFLKLKITNFDYRTNFLRNILYILKMKYNMEIPFELFDNENFNEVLRIILKQYFYICDKEFILDFLFVDYKKFYNFLLVNIMKYEDKFDLYFYPDIKNLDFDRIYKSIGNINLFIIDSLEGLENFIKLTSDHFINEKITKLVIKIYIQNGNTITSKNSNKIDDLKRLSKFKNLEDLVIHYNNYNENILKLPKLEKLKNLVIENFKGTEIIFRNLKSLESLSIVAFDSEKIPLKKISKISLKLENLYISSKNENNSSFDSIFETLKKFKNLKSLYIENFINITNITDLKDKLNLKELYTSKSIIDFNIKYSTKKHVIYIRNNIPTLSSFKNLNYTCLTDKNLNLNSYIPDLDIINRYFIYLHVESIHIRNININKSITQILGKSICLKYLSLNNIGFSPGSFNDLIKDLKYKIKKLVVKRCDIVPEEIYHIQELKYLEDLEVDFTNLNASYKIITKLFNTKSCFQNLNYLYIIKDHNLKSTVDNLLDLTSLVKLELFPLFEKEKNEIQTKIDEKKLKLQVYERQE